MIYTHFKPFVLISPKVYLKKFIFFKAKKYVFLLTINHPKREKVLTTFKQNPLVLMFSL